MTLQIYTDAHVAMAVVFQLRNSRISVVRCEDVGLKFERNDEVHLIYATGEKRAVLTSDEDFLQLHAKWQQAGMKQSGIIYIQHERKDNIGLIVGTLSFLNEAIEGGAATLDEEVYNRVVYI